MNEILVKSLMFAAPIGVGITLTLLLRKMEKPLASVWYGFLVMIIATAVSLYYQLAVLIKDANQEIQIQKEMAGELWQNTFKGDQIGIKTLNYYFSCDDVSVFYVETKCRAATIALLKRDGLSTESILVVHRKFDKLDKELKAL